jgi:hypothetical protein
MCHASRTDLQLAGQPTPASPTSERTAAVQIADGIGHAVLWEEANGRTSLMPHFLQAQPLRRTVGKGGYGSVRVPLSDARVRAVLPCNTVHVALIGSASAHVTGTDS